jgi:hypothetical protein
MKANNLDRKVVLNKELAAYFGGLHRFGGKIVLHCGTQPI